MYEHVILMSKLSGALLKENLAVLITVFKAAVILGHEQAKAIWNGSSKTRTG